VIIALTKRGGFARSVAKRGVDSVERESVRDESGQIDLVDGDELEPAPRALTEQVATANMGVGSTHPIL